MNSLTTLERLENGAFDDMLRTLYGEQALSAQRRRYADALARFSAAFPDRSDVRLFSASGRTEIGGNHTDHQHGCALGAAVNRDVLAVVSFHEEGLIRIKSEGYGLCVVDPAQTERQAEEQGSMTALVRGVAAGFARRGARIGGFDAYLTSDVPGGSGLSSSAAFETALGAVIDRGYCGGKTGATEIAKIGQHAENAYFGKSSGLLDQLVCATGGFVFLDFRNVAQPVVRQCHADFAAAGYDLCVTDTKGSHADLTDDYAAIPLEMGAVAACFGKQALREVDEQAFYAAVPVLRRKCSDRAILRAAHFFAENRRAQSEAEALERGDFDAFFRLYRASSASSETLLQNLYTTKAPTEQGIPLALMMSRLVLGEDAAVRVHGGGFAGTVQAIVPQTKTAAYTAAMNALFGEGSCDVLRVRPVGGVEICGGEKQ